MCAIWESGPPAVAHTSDRPTRSRSPAKFSCVKGLFLCSVRGVRDPGRNVRGLMSMQLNTPQFSGLWCPQSFRLGRTSPPKPLFAKYVNVCRSRSAASFIARALQFEEARATVSLRGCDGLTIKFDFAADKVAGPPSGAARARQVSQTWAAKIG